VFTNTRQENHDLQELITAHISKMDGKEVDTEEYERSARALKVLMEARKIEEDIENPDEAASRKLNAEAVLLEIEAEKPWYLVSTDQAAGIAASLAGILLVLHFEKLNVMTSKAMGLLPKIKF
jgi:5'-deoxynucleotidase YfbR-like HD superfamily hydrolase